MLFTFLVFPLFDKKKPFASSPLNVMPKSSFGEFIGASIFRTTYCSLVTVPVIAGWAVVVAVISYGCALLGMRVLHKHFERANVA